MRRRTLELSLEGARFIGAFEGFSPVCYDDGGPGRGNCTIGYGHLVHYGPTTAADRRRWGSITRAQAARMLIEDARPALYGIERHIAIPLDPAQVGALCSFAYNCGPAALAGHVAAAVNAKPAHRLPSARRDAWHQRVAAALQAWDHAGGILLAGLERRRRAESVYFSTGRATVAAGNPYANS